MTQQTAVDSNPVTKLAAERKRLLAEQEKYQNEYSMAHQTAVGLAKRRHTGKKVDEGKLDEARKEERAAEIELESISELLEENETELRIAAQEETQRRHAEAKRLEIEVKEFEKALEMTVAREYARVVVALRQRFLLDLPRPGNTIVRAGSMRLLDVILVHHADVVCEQVQEELADGSWDELGKELDSKRQLYGMAQNALNTSAESIVSQALAAADEKVGE